MMDTLILVLFVASLAPQAFCQDDTRGTINEKGIIDGGGQSRTIYSQSRPLSPHRMMHFGKRPVNPLQPTIVVPAGFNDLRQNDGLQLGEAQNERLARLIPERYNNRYLDSPYLYSIELERGRTLQELPQEFASSFFTEGQPNKNLLYNLDRPSASDFGLISEQQLQQVARAQNAPKLLRMIMNNEATNDDASAQDDGSQLQRTTPNQQQAINVSTRSIQSGRGNTLNLPKAFIPSLLFDRHGSSSMSGFGSFNKKAEPKDNFFMHFGRK